MINPVDDGARNTLSDSMGIFNAISGTPTSAHGSTTILWYSQTHTFITTKDWLNYLQVKRKQFGHILRQPEAIIHCFFFSLSISVHAMSWEIWCSLPVISRPFVLVSYGDSSEYCWLSSFENPLIARFGSFIFLYSLFYPMEDGVKNMWWLSKCVSNTVTGNIMLS